MKTDDFSGRGRLIKGSEKKTATTAWIAFLIFGGLFGFSLWKSQMPFWLPHIGLNPIACIFAIFILIPLAIALVNTIRLQQFGDPSLELDHVATSPGENLSGRIELGSRRMRAPEFTVRLKCRHAVQQPGDKNASIRTIWHGEAKATMLPGGVLPISIYVPDGQPPTNENDPSDRIYWELTVKAPFFPLGFSERYPVLIRAGAHSVARSENTRPENGSWSGAQKQTSPRPFMFLLFIPALVAGIWLLKNAGQDFSRTLVATNWPTVVGKITDSRVLITRGRKSNGYKPHVAYTYTVEGMSYGGDAIYPHWFWSHSSSYAAVAQFPIGQPATIHYEPAHPENSILLPGARAGAFQGLICAGLALSLAFLVGVACFAPRRDIIMSGNTMSFRAGSLESKLSGYAILAMILLGLALWYVT